MGVKNLGRQKALPSKWSWSFATREGLFGIDVIKGKYGAHEGGWCLEEVRGYGLGVWKAIRRRWPLINNKLSFVVGNGWECGRQFGGGGP